MRREIGVDSRTFKEGPTGQSRDVARLIIAGALSEPDSRFWTIIQRAIPDLELLERD